MRLLKVGRDSSCDIVLHSGKASALHAEITILNNGDILLEDKNSLNGTFVMNRPIKPGTQVPIRRGDAIRFADVELIWNQVPMPEDLSQYKAVYGIGTSMRNDIQIAGPTVSRYHATLKIDRKGHAFIQDHSKNGTTINGERLANGQTRQIKRSDSVACGGVPVNLQQYIPGNNLPLILGIVAAVCIVCLGGWGVYKYFWTPTPPPVDPIDKNLVSPVTPKAMEYASACVYGGYYFEITLPDDPFAGKIREWPEKWSFGFTPDGDLVSMDFNVYCENGQSYYGQIQPKGFTGTAFFISENGEMGTNRHIACPWLYNNKEYVEQIRNFITIWANIHAGLLSTISSTSIVEYLATPERLKSTVANMEIGGRFEFFGIGLTGSKIDNERDLLSAQVIAESGDEKQDVALIRLKSAKTPENIVKLGAIYDISQARVDETTLVPQKEELTIIGYPMGFALGGHLFDGKELHPTHHMTRISQVAGDNMIQIQETGIGGFSGSPVSDATHRLVGVLCSGIDNTNVTFCCNIKYLVELYNKHKFRE